MQQNLFWLCVKDDFDKLQVTNDRKKYKKFIISCNMIYILLVESSDGTGMLQVLLWLVTLITICFV